MEEEVERKSKNKKRFSDEQVKYLEAVFESESKLEPRKKEEVAAELGMQPRQVAIWFQNKRARWKSKQIEQDYKALRDSYDNLTSKFESLKTEKQSLLAQLQQLLEKPAGGGGGGGRGINLVESSSSDGRSNTAGGVAKLSCQDHRLLVKCSDEDNNNNNNNKGRSHQEGPAHELLLNRCENGDHVSQETNGKWFGFGSGGIYDQSCNISQLWDFWSN